MFNVSRFITTTYMQGPTLGPTSGPKIGSNAATMLIPCFCKYNKINNIIWSKY